MKNNPTSEEMDHAMRVETLRKQWRAKQIAFKEIPAELVEEVTGRSPTKAVTK